MYKYDILVIISGVSFQIPLPVLFLVMNLVTPRLQSYRKLREIPFRAHLNGDAFPPQHKPLLFVIELKFWNKQEYISTSCHLNFSADNFKNSELIARIKSTYKGGNLKVLK
jgi:hypothetical protein